MSATSDFDVVVVGSGAAGLAAAATAGALGARVLVVESERRIGGSTRLSDAMLQAAGTPQQRAVGIDDTPQAMFEYYTTLNRWQIEPGLARAFCDDAPSIIDWLETLGLAFGPVEHAGNEPVPRGHPTIGLGEALVDALQAECNRCGVELALDNRVEELLVDAGRIVGVRARGEDATADAVVIAAGGFAHNPELIRRFLGGRMLAGDHPLSPAAAGSRGDALVLGQAVGAAVAGRDRAHWVPGPLVPPEVVLLNGDGRRFVDEPADHSVRTIVAKYHGTATSRSSTSGSGAPVPPMRSSHVRTPRSSSVRSRCASTSSPSPRGCATAGSRRATRWVTPRPASGSTPRR